MHPFCQNHCYHRPGGALEDRRWLRIILCFVGSHDQFALVCAGLVRGRGLKEANAVAKACVEIELGQADNGIPPIVVF